MEYWVQYNLNSLHMEFLVGSIKVSVTGTLNIPLLDDQPNL